MCDCTSSSPPATCPFLWMASSSCPCQCITYAQAYQTQYDRYIIAWAVITYTFLGIAVIQSYRVGVIPSMYYRIRYIFTHERKDFNAAKWTIQTKMHLMCTMMATLLCARQTDPLGWNHSIPWGLLGLLIDAAASFTLSLICSCCFSFISLMYRLSGHHNVTHVIWVERCFHLSLLLSFSIVSAQQAYTSPTYVFKATKYVFLIIFISCLMICGLTSAYSIVRALQKSISSLRDSNPSLQAKTRSIYASTTPNQNTPKLPTKHITHGSGFDSTLSTPRQPPRTFQKRQQTPLTPLRTLHSLQNSSTSTVQHEHFTNIMMDQGGVPIHTTTSTPTLSSTATSTTASPTASPLTTNRTISRPVSAADSSLQAIKSMIRVFACWSLFGVAAIIFMIITLINIVRQKEDYFIQEHVPAPPTSVIDSSLPLDVIQIGTGLWCLKSFRKIARPNESRTHLNHQNGQSILTTQKVKQPSAHQPTQISSAAGGGQGAGVTTPSTDIRSLYQTHHTDAYAIVSPETERHHHAQHHTLTQPEHKQETIAETSIEIEMMPTPIATPQFLPMIHHSSASASALTSSPVFYRASPSLSFHPSSLAIDVMSSPSSFRLDTPDPNRKITRLSLNYQSDKQYDADAI